MIQEEASIPASFVHCGPHSFTPGSFVQCWPTFVHPYLIRSLPALIRSSLTHIRSSLPHSFIAGPHSFSAGPHSFIPGHIFHLKNWLNCHLQEKLVVDNNPESAKLEEVRIVQNVTI